MAGHHTSEANPGSFNPYLEGMSYPGQYGLYPHHFSKLRGPHDLNYGDYPTKPQQAVPTYKWMQVKRNVPKPGEFPNWVVCFGKYQWDIEKHSCVWMTRCDRNLTSSIWRECFVAKMPPQQTNFPWNSEEEKNSDILETMSLIGWIYDWGAWGQSCLGSGQKCLEAAAIPRSGHSLDCLMRRSKAPSPIKQFPESRRFEYWLGGPRARRHTRLRVIIHSEVGTRLRVQHLNSASNKQTLLFHHSKSSDVVLVLLSGMSSWCDIVMINSKNSVIWWSDGLVAMRILVLFIWFGISRSAVVGRAGQTHHIIITSGAPMDRIRK